MADKVELTPVGLRNILRLAEKNRGKAWAVTWLRDEWNHQPETMYDLLMALIDKSEESNVS